MEITFRKTEMDPVFSTYHPVHGKARFLRDGTYDVADDFGEHLINSRPTLFGKTENDILRARGLEPVVKKKSTKQLKKDIPNGTLEPKKTTVRKTAANTGGK